MWSRLPVEFDEGGLVPIAVTRERRKAHLRDCYPMLYQTEDKERSGRRKFGAACAAVTAAVLCWLWLS
jgi:hypothetical protein